ncbi:MAG: hypothetical protein AB7I96_08675 [Candidatus Dadabacteria bacterium]
MDALVVCFVIFVIICLSSILGIILRAVLPARHLTEDSKNMITIGMGIVATMAAIATGMFVQGAQENFRDQRSDLIGMGAKIVLIDKILKDYGPEADGTRSVLRWGVKRTLEQLWPTDGSTGAEMESDEEKSETLYYSILSLKPDTDARSALRDEALSLSYDLAEGRAALVMAQNKVAPGAFLFVIGVIVFWFVAIFFSFGLFAPTNATVVTTLAVAALSVALALFLIMELNTPFMGYLRMPDAPIVDALNHISK